MNEVRRRILASRAQERERMESLGGKRHAGSGAGARKGDGRVNGASWRDPDHQLLEFKRTDKSQITVKASDLEKIISEALAEGRIPALGVELGGRHYVLEMEGDYRERLELIRDLRAQIEDLGGDA